MNESELVRRSKTGDRQAQKELYEQTVNRIYRLIFRMTGNEHDAFDLVQDTYVRAFGHIDQFDGKSAFATWLYRVACNETRQFLRASARRAEETSSLALQTSASTGEDGADKRLDVTAALVSLSPEEREILLLRYHEGLDYRQMAQVFECAAGTVASRLNRARSQLGTILEKSYRTSEES